MKIIVPTYRDAQGNRTAVVFDTATGLVRSKLLTRAVRLALKNVKRCARQFPVWPGSVSKVLREWS